MINFSGNLMHGKEHANLACFYRTYVLYRNGLMKTCTHDEAITLLRTGKWYDITEYQPNEEVLTYEKHEQQYSAEPTPPSEREEPKHKQRECPPQQREGKELDCETNGTRSPNSEVKKRGRPKAIK